jgi:hypothetical protein
LRYLADVNARVALLDEAHVFHLQALDFFSRRRLAPCALSMVVGDSDKYLLKL